MTFPDAVECNLAGVALHIHQAALEQSILSHGACQTRSYTVTPPSMHTSLSSVDRRIVNGPLCRTNQSQELVTTRQVSPAYSTRKRLALGKAVACTD